MRKHLKTFVLIGWLAVAGAAMPNAFAQEADLQTSTAAKDQQYTHKDGVNLRVQEATLSQNETSRGEQAADSLTVASGSKNLDKNEKAKEGEEDDLVSFNFLYYIIQRYKMSDIVDK